MSWFKKFWIVFVSFLPFTAGALTPFAFGIIAGLGSLAGFAVYRSHAPVNMQEAFNFFSTCWSCQMFSDILGTMSNIIPGIYHGIGLVTIPFAAALLAVWFAWQLLSNFMNAKNIEPWSFTGEFGTKIIKLGVAGALLFAPLPRLINDIAIQPIFNIGMSINHVVADDEAFNTCIVATAIADPASATAASASRGAFSPKLRHHLACELATIHQMTGLGMTAGWTMLNMAFNKEYMHKIMWGMPILPNVPILLCGALVVVLFFMALLPIPIYFLEIFINLSIDLIMLPISLLSWIFTGWNILPNSKKNIKTIIEDVVQGALGIALTGVFVTFAIMFLDAIFGSWEGITALKAAMEQNDSKIIMDGLMMRRDSLVTIVLLGAFMAMFMTTIPTLIKTLFSVKISDEFYEKTKKDAGTLWEDAKKLYAGIKK